MLSRSAVAPAVGLALACAMLATQAKAGESAPLSLEWTAPPGCPTTAEMRAEVRGAIGQSGPGERVTASATASEREARWHGSVELTVGALHSTRSVDGESCRAVADAIAVIVALAVSPPHETPPVKPPSPVPQEAPRSRGALHLGASFLVDGETLPSAGFGAEVAAGWAVSHLELDVVGSWLGPQKALLPAIVGVPQGAHIGLWELRGRGCYDLLGGKVALGPCAGLGVEWLVADGFGATTVRSAADPVGVASLGGALIVWLTPHVGARLSGEAIVPFTRPTFVIDDGGRVYHASALSARGALGLDVHF